MSRVIATGRAQLGNGAGEVHKSFSRFLRAVKDGNPSAIEKQGGVWTVTKGSMDELSGGAGGWLVPVEYTSRFFTPLAERGFIYRRALVIPMGTSEMTGPMVDATSTQSAWTNPLFGGVLAKWGSQAGTLTKAESEPTIRGQNLHAWDLLVYAIASNQLLTDIGPEADARLLDIFGKAAAWYAEYAFLQGTGAAAEMPLGMLNAPCLIKVTRHTSSHISVQDFAAMEAKLLPLSHETAIWAASPSALGDIKATTGWVPNVLRKGEPGEPSGYINDKPLFPTDKLPTLGTSGDIMLIDPMTYIIGDRMQVVIDVSKHAPYGSASVFQQYQSMFKVWLRLDGKPLLNSYVTLADASSTASTMICLA